MKIKEWLSKCDEEGISNRDMIDMFLFYSLSFVLIICFGLAIR